MKKSEPALLRSLEDALHQVVPTRPLTKQEEEALAEAAQQFAEEHRPLIERFVAFQALAESDPELQALSAAAAKIGRVGADGKLDPRVVDVAERIAENPHFAELSQAAASYGVRGVGLIAVGLEAALFAGVQVGAEVVYMRPYAVGDYTVPAELVARAWYQVTLGIDVGISGTIAPWPLDQSFWFTAPVNTKHLVSAYLSAVPVPGIPYPVGVRLEIFGWLPENSGPGFDPAAIFDHIHGFRLVVEAGLHYGVGVGFLGHQVASNGGLQLATLTISPNNLTPGPKFTLNGTITAPRSGGQPNRILHSATTLKLTFPKWVFSAMNALPAVAFTNDGTGSATGWKAAGSTVKDGQAVFDFTWVGKDNLAWLKDMTFTVPAYSSDTPPQKNGTVLCSLDNLGSADLSVDRSGARTEMSLSTLVFNAAGPYALTVDLNHCTIENQPAGTKYMSGTVNATTANAADNHDNNFYGIVDPTDKTKILTVDDSDGVSWWCGYQFQQATTDGDVVCAQYRALLWKVNSSAAERNYCGTDWQYALSDNTAHSIAYWSNGKTSKASYLDVLLKPIIS